MNKRQNDKFQLTNRGGRLNFSPHLPCPLWRRGAGQLRKRLPLLIFQEAAGPGPSLIERSKR